MDRCGARAARAGGRRLRIDVDVRVVGLLIIKIEMRARVCIYIYVYIRHGRPEYVHVFHAKGYVYH